MNQKFQKPHGSVFHFLNSHLRWFLWLDSLGNHSVKIMGFGAWHIKFQNLVLSFTIDVLFNLSLSLLIHKIWILVIPKVVVKFSMPNHVECSVSVNFSFLLLNLPQEMININIWGDSDEFLTLMGPLPFLWLKLWALDNCLLHYLGWLI